MNSRLRKSFVGLQPLEPVPEYVPPEVTVPSAADVEPVSMILPYLYLGSAKDADPDRLRALNITHVLNAAKELGGAPSTVAGVERMDLPIYDVHTENIERYFEQAAEFIQSAEAEAGRVLVHCRKGISRSPTLVVAYLMRTKGMKCDDALQFVRQRRSKVSPNMGFMEALRAADNDTGLSTSTDLTSSVGGDGLSDTEEPMAPRLPSTMQFT
jgi:hypothetical protein